jgi:hypothetical protein
MRYFTLSLFFLSTCLLASPPTKHLSKCAQLLSDGLSSSESFILLVSRKLAEDGHLPRVGTLSQRLARLSIGDLASLLAHYKLEVEDWKSVQEFKFTNATLGSEEFLAEISKSKVGGAKITAEQREVLSKLHDAAAATREKLKNLIGASEEIAFSQRKTLLTGEQLVETLRQLSLDPKMELSYLGVKDLADWRYRLLTERTSFRARIIKDLEGAVLAIVGKAGEIPENAEQTLQLLAESMGVSKADLGTFFGPGSLFDHVDQLTDSTIRDHAAQFTKVIDRRVFSESRQAEMLKAIRNAMEVVLFKAAENQDILDFEAVRELSRAHGDAPIIVAPPFAEIGKIPKTMDWLFNEPNVFFMVDRGIQLGPDFYIVDHGYEDKRENPFTGLDKVYAPTDRVIQFHPKVRAITRATGNYSTHPGYFVSTGTMSDPAYWGKFAISMSTDERAQMEAEQNRSVMLLSRRYRSEKFGSLVGSANGIAPRRVRFTESRYGYPAGLFDLGKIYSKTGVTQVKSLPGIVLGDWHFGDTDPGFVKATGDALERLGVLEKNPLYGQGFHHEYRPGPVGLGTLVFHDLIAGTPNNRHTLESLLSRAVNDISGTADLANHIQSAAAFIAQLQQTLPDTLFVVPVDNHGSDWLWKRLQEGDLFKAGRARELPMILRLMREAIEQKVNPYEQIFKYYGLNTDKVRFMDKTETFRVGIDLENPTSFRMVHGVDVSQHSQNGINGSKSISLAKLLVAYGANVTGHTHSSAEHGQSVKVGTGTAVKQDFHRGPSNSDASIAIVYSDQAIQLLRLEKGVFLPNAGPQDPSEFFPSAEYPRMLIRKMPPGGFTTDQFRSGAPTDRKPR